MSKYLKYISFIILLFLGVGNVHAQTKNIYVRTDDASKIGLEDIEVYSFQHKFQAEKALKKLNQTGGLDKQKDEYIAKTKTGVGPNKGRTRISVPSNGWLVIYLYGEIYIKSVESASLIDNEYIFEIHTEIRTFKQADFTVKRKGKKPETPGEASTCGDVLTISPTPIYIDSLYARNNARFVVSPIVVSRDNPKDTIGFLPPRVLDGIDYDPSQVRYTGFDQIKIGDNYYNKNDIYYKNHSIMGEEPMKNYFNKGMKTREEDTIYFKCMIRPYNKERPWKIIGHCWYEDYKNVYHEKSILLHAGYTTDISRFLDWQTSIPEVEIDASHYTILARTEKIENLKSVRLNFNVGEATLNYADSMNLVYLNDIESNLRNILSIKDSEFHGVTLRGFASPEGNEAHNRQLAYRRALFVKSYLEQHLIDCPNFYVKSTDSDIIPWTTVADTIDAQNNPKYEGIAHEIREICQQRQTLTEQGKIIQSKSWYKLVNESILPLMRRVDIISEYIEQKELTSKEIYERYKDYEKSRYLSGGAQPYQYYQLMNYLYENKNWDELYEIAKVAYNMGKEAVQKKDISNQLIDIAVRSTITDSIQDIKTAQIEIIDSLGNKTFESKVDTFYAVTSKTEYRPYPLAAYYLAKSKLERGDITPSDTILLKGYLDDSNQGHFSDFPDEEGFPHYWNEEAIAVTQILIYCALKDFMRARYDAAYHLPKDERFISFQSFLDFLSCDFSQRPKEERDQIRKVIGETSSNNYVVANLTKEEINGEIGFKRALRELEENKDSFDTSDAYYYYLLAICKFQVDCNRQDYNIYVYDSRNAYDPNPESIMNWGAPMLEALKRNPQYIKDLKEDGFFNDAYRTMILFFWQRMQDGAEMADIAREYDELAKKYFKPEKAQSNSKTR